MRNIFQRWEDLTGYHACSCCEMNLLLLGLDQDGLAPSLFLVSLRLRRAFRLRGTWQLWVGISFATCKHLLFGIKRQDANCQRIVAAETLSAWMPA